MESATFLMFPRAGSQLSADRKVDKVKIHIDFGSAGTILLNQGT